MDEHEKICSTEENALVSEVGHLSLNEESQVRFHGQASGLHLLDVKDRNDGRNEGGIWLVAGFIACSFTISMRIPLILPKHFRRFPKARVWPPLPVTESDPQPHGEEQVVTLPDVATQDQLLEIYFAYVHPALPVLHKKSFLEELCVVSRHISRRYGNLILLF